MKSRAPAGYTLIEVVVAILVFSVGMLAVTASSAVIGRSMNLDAIRERASRIAEARLESLSASCPTATSGTETVGQIHSHWSTSASGGRSLITASVTYPGSKSLKTDNYTLRLSCP